MTDKEKHMSYLDGFKVMQCFLEKYYQSTHSNDIGSLLGDLQLLADGRTADPAAWEDWIKCVNSVLKEN